MRLARALLLLALAGCGEPEEAIVAGQYDGGFPDGSYYERLTVQVVTEVGSSRIIGRGWLRRQGADLNVPVVTGAALPPADVGAGGEAVMFLLQHEGGISTLYVDVVQSGRRLEGVFNGRGGGVAISLRRLRTPTSPSPPSSQAMAPQ